MFLHLVLNVLAELFFQKLPQPNRFLEVAFLLLLKFVDARVLYRFLDLAVFVAKLIELFTGIS